MCGTSGILTFDPKDTVDEALVRRMTAILSHRGPGDEGFFGSRALLKFEIWHQQFITAVTERGQAA